MLKLIIVVAIHGLPLFFFVFASDFSVPEIAADLNYFFLLE
jgi:hypothetical protein